MPKGKALFLRAKNGAAYPKEQPLSPQQLRDLLPNVGDHVRKIPTTVGDKLEKASAMPGRVVYVNAAKLWYTVEFYTRMGYTFREAYKLPEQKRDGRTV